MAVICVICKLLVHLFKPHRLCEAERIAATARKAKLEAKLEAKQDTHCHQNIIPDNLPAVSSYAGFDDPGLSRLDTAVTEGPLFDGTLFQGGDSGGAGASDTWGVSGTESSDTSSTSSCDTSSYDTSSSCDSNTTSGDF